MASGATLKGCKPAKLYCSSIFLLRNVQEVQLDKHVKLLDSPGIVMDSGTSDSSIILRNCVKVMYSQHKLTKEFRIQLNLI